MDAKQLAGNHEPTGDTAAFWDRRAAIYDKAVGDGRGFHRDMIARIKQALKPEDTVAEIACGTGAVACAIAAHVKTVYAGDIAPKMLQIAGLRAREQGLDNMRFSRENAYALSYPDKFCDAVIICAVLHLMPRPDKAMAEIQRILKPGGLLFASAYLAGQSLTSRMGNAMMSIGGYRDRQKWQREAFLAFLEEQGFALKDRCYYPVFPIPVQYVTARVQTQLEKGKAAD